MGGWLSYLWWGGDPDVVNPISGLTRREIYAVQRSWALVHKDSTANGIELLKRYDEMDFNKIKFNSDTNSFEVSS